VPVGTVIDFAGYTAPSHYLLCDGTNTYSRITYQQLFAALTLQSTVTLASSTTYTDANAPKLSIGTYVEGTGIPAATTITNISGTTVTISNAATVSTSQTLRYFPWGAGSTTSNFAVPNLQGKVVAGVGGTALDINGTTPNTLGEAVGAATVTLNANNLPAHTHSLTYNPTAGTVGGGVGSVEFSNTPGATGNNTTTNSAFSIVQPTTVLYKYIRYE
jgi:microcystin-dependent protein